MKELAEAVADRSAIRWKNGACILIGMPEGPAREKLVHTVRECSGGEGIAVLTTLRELEAHAGQGLPGVILLSEELLRSGVSLSEAAQRLSLLAPVVVLASAERQSEVVGLVVSGDVDFVSCSGQFATVAAAFIKQRLSRLQDWSHEFHTAWMADIPSDFAELLRHEINNPLTGILGNAELLLSELRGKIPRLSVQRLETVVDLAVRLREKVRRLVSEPGNGQSNINSH